MEIEMSLQNKPTCLLSNIRKPPDAGSLYQGAVAFSWDETMECKTPGNIELFPGVLQVWRNYIERRIAQFKMLK